MGFEELGLSPEILKAVKKIGFTEPTMIQKSCIPKIREGHDLVAQSLTGSGKTAAFGFPLLEKIRPGKGLQALILAPTRELASQDRDALVNFSAFMKVFITAVYGGVSMQPQINDLRKADIVVATPGRMLDHIRHNTINLRHVSILVLDEADKMFEMGFIDDIKRIIGSIPKERQTLLFSATMPMEIHHLASKYLKDPINIREKIHVEKHLLKQVYYNVMTQDKFSLLVYLLKKKTPGLAIVFCATRREVDILARNLKMQKINAMAVHGGLSQQKRSHAVDSLKKENIDVLVATDVAARGLDINNISHIYNFHSPKSSLEYTHRIGRTARAGKYGEAVTLLSERDYDDFSRVLDDSSINIEKEELPSFQRIPYIRSTPRDRDTRYSGQHGRQRFGNYSQRPRSSGPGGQRRAKRKFNR